MNHNQSPDDLSAALHRIADGVEFVPPAASDTDFAATVRQRTHVARRHRRNQRVGIITTCLAMVAVGGVVVVQNLPGVGAQSTSVAAQPGPENQIQTATGFAPTCGAKIEYPKGAGPLTLVSQVHADAEGTSLNRSAPADAPFYPDITIGEIVPLQVMNSGKETLTATSTGYARLVIVQDGVVVAEPDDVPNTYANPTLKAGEAKSILSSRIIPCEGTVLKDGNYDVYGFLDAQVSSETDAAVIYGGPWNIRIGDTKVTLQAESKLCGVATSKITHFNGFSDLELAGGSVTPTEEIIESDFDPQFTNETPFPEAKPESYETYLVAGGKVVASATAGDQLDLDLVQHGIRDFPVPTMSCDGKTPVQPGEYEFFAIVNWVDETSGDALPTSMSGYDPITVK